MADGTGTTERDTVLTSLRAALPELAERWPIKSLGLFGSFARNEPDDDSDVDLLVEFASPIGLSAFLALEERLCGIVKRPVELVSRAALKPHIGRNVMRDLVLL
jgi:predicted nucleotidyltransferase